MSEFILTLDPLAARVTQSLNGIWEIAGGDEARPLMPFASTISVPSLVDCAEPAYDFERFEYQWYRTRFSVRGEGDLRALFLKIRQSMFGAAVWVNGEPAGGSISCYTPQVYKIDEYCTEGTPNEILVRVGARSTLPPESAVGRDQERERFIPGIWGDCELFACGEVRINSIQTVPHIRRSVAEIRVVIENFSSTSRHISLIAGVQEKKSKRPASDLIPKQVAISAYGTERVTFQIPVESMKLWSLESPFLYAARVSVQEGGLLHDTDRAVFGMRTFAVEGADFYLNGKKILLRGGNIALHRFFSDPMRRMLPWNEEWIRRVLIDIPKAHHFNFFRNHIGPLYHRWYDIADEYGMLLQNEWQFWCPTGSKEQIRKEFTEWIVDGCNHPSIVMWDPLNESSDDVIRYEIVPEMKELDPTRPWESADCFEQHPYLYSLGMVLNDRAFGFTASLEEIEHSHTPSVVNEFLWWWLDSENAPTSLMKDVTERWLGHSYTQTDLIERQSFLAQELVELFRRMRVRAIQPFVYLSNNDGPTGNWFLGEIGETRPKPVMAALKNAFAPFGLSIELWDRHFFAGGQREVRIFVFNDTQSQRRGTLRVSVVSDTEKPGTHDPNEDESMYVTVPPCDTTIVPVTVGMPNVPGTYRLRAELIAEEESSFFIPGAHSAENGRLSSAVSQKVLHVFEPAQLPHRAGGWHLTVLDPSGEIPAFLGVQGAQSALTRDTQMVITHGPVVAHATYQQMVPEISSFVRTGGTLLVIEPEYRVVGSASLPLVNDVELSIQKRSDRDKGGYDSYVFAEDESHPVWASISKEHMMMFNGAYGGEAVSEYDVIPSVRYRTLASSGLGLRVMVMMEIPYAKGRIIVSRLQCRGRLVNGTHEGGLFARRADPVVQRILINLIEYGAAQ